MTDAEDNAEQEIRFMQENCNAILDARQKGDFKGSLAYWRNVVNYAKHLKDCENNNISDFLIDNAKDNHHYDDDLNKCSKDDVRGIFSDVVKAIQSDTQTLLNE